MKNVFLGGTCNGSKWRQKLIPLLKIDYFNPVVEDWNEQAQNKQIEQRKNCDYCLYTITPMMTGVYSIAEVVDDSNKRPQKTILYIKKTDYDEEQPDTPYVFKDHQLKSILQVAKLVKENGGTVFTKFKQLVDYLNRG